MEFFFSGLFQGLLLNKIVFLSENCLHLIIIFINPNLNTHLEIFYFYTPPLSYPTRPPVCKLKYPHWYALILYMKIPPLYFLEHRG